MRSFARTKNVFHKICRISHSIGINPHHVKAILCCKSLDNQSKYSKILDSLFDVSVYSRRPTNRWYLKVTCPIRGFVGIQFLNFSFFWIVNQSSHKCKIFSWREILQNLKRLKNHHQLTKWALVRPLFLGAGEGSELFNFFIQSLFNWLLTSLIFLLLQ